MTAAIGAGCLAVTVAAGGVAVAAHGDHGARTDGASAGARSDSTPTGPVAAPASPAPQSPVSAAPRQRTAAASSLAGVIEPTAVHVPKLRHLTAPDAVVTLRHTAPQAAITKLRSRAGVRSVAALDRGVVRLHHRSLRVAGVSLADIRGFTPRVTAASTPLWKSVARGELTVSYSSTRHLEHHLGATFPARGADGSRAPLRIGAFATLDLSSAQGIVSHQRARSLGLSPGRQVLVAAPKISLDALRRDITATLGHRATVHITRPEPVDQAVLSPLARSVIPASYLDLYRRAAVTCPGLPWTVLAGIGTVETGNGSNVHRSIAGAEGPMQFIPSTWKMYGVDADGDGKANIQDPTDAIFSAARYLCAAGAGRGTKSIDNAIFSYNHAWWYVREVLVFANRYQ
jgi:hypothetical protein